jgi:hypothetical protein
MRTALLWTMQRLSGSFLPTWRNRYNVPIIRSKITTARYIVTQRTPFSQPQQSVPVRKPQSQQSAVLRIPQSQQSALLRIPQSQQSALLRIPQSQQSALLRIPQSQHSFPSAIWHWNIPSAKQKVALERRKTGRRGPERYTICPVCTNISNVHTHVYRFSKDATIKHYLLYFSGF